MLEKFVEFIKAHKDPVFKIGVVLFLGAAGAVLLGQLAADEDEPEFDGESPAVDSSTEVPPEQ